MGGSEEDGNQQDKERVETAEAGRISCMPPPYMSFQELAKQHETHTPSLSSSIIPPTTGRILSCTSTMEQCDTPWLLEKPPLLQH